MAAGRREVLKREFIMSEPLPRVFLSSTIYDLRDLRDAVQTALRKEGSVRWMNERNAKKRRVRFETAEHTFQRDLRKWEVAWEKLHHG